MILVSARVIGGLARDEVVEESEAVERVRDDDPDE
jgi:hypothetical protein